MDEPDVILTLGTDEKQFLQCGSYALLGKALNHFHLRVYIKGLYRIDPLFIAALNSEIAVCLAFC